MIFGLSSLNLSLSEADLLSNFSLAQCWKRCSESCIIVLQLSSLIMKMCNHTACHSNVSYYYRSEIFVVTQYIHHLQLSIGTFLFGKFLATNGFYSTVCSIQYNLKYLYNCRINSFHVIYSNLWAFMFWIR